MEEREKVREIYLLIHGVESRALGMEALRGAMYDDDYFPFGSCRVKLHKYGRFPVCLAVFKSFQDAYSDLLFYHILTLAGKYPNLQKINFIAHSWGTYLLERAMEKISEEAGRQQAEGSRQRAEGKEEGKRRKEEGRREGSRQRAEVKEEGAEFEVLKKISEGLTVLLGCVLPRKKEQFLAQYVDVYPRKTINVVGENDRVVKTAGLFKCFGYGNSGAYGFDELYSTKHTENIYTGWNHTDYAKDENIRSIIEWLKK